jgi:hypothetical protein
MRREDRELKAPEAAGPGEPVRTDTWVEKWVEVAGTFEGGALVEGRLSEGSSDWHEVDTVTGGGSTALFRVEPLI